MGKLRVKKKLRKSKKSNFTIYCLIVFSILFVALLFVCLFSNNNDVFKVESRKEMVNDNKKIDTEQYETIGWVRVQGTNIDYPVIKILDEDYGHPVNGTSYAWSINDGSTIEKKMDISGHNILNLSKNPVKKDEMFIYFEELMNFVYYDFAKENQFIQLHINGKEYVYKIFSINFLKPFDVNSFAKNGYENDEMTYFLNVLDKGNLYDYDIDVNEDDKMISLYTCTKFFGNEMSANLVVTGRLLRENEKIELSSIETTEKYNEIVDIMEGGEENE